MSESLTYYAQTVPGLEQITWLELRQRVPEAEFGEFLYARDKQGVVLFDYAGPLEALLDLRTAEGLYLAAISLPKVTRGRQDLDHFRRLVFKSGDLGRAINFYGRLRRKHLHTIQVAAHHYGEHQYQAQELAAIVRQAVAELYPHFREGGRQADVNLAVDLYGSHLLLGLRLSTFTPPGFNRAKTRLPNSVAAAMILLTNPAGTDIFLDPLADDSTLVRERLAVGPAKDVWAGVRRRPRRTQVEVAFKVWQGSNLPLGDQSIDKIASYWPTNQNYDWLLAETARLLRPGGRAVVFSHQYERIKKLIRQYKTLAVSRGYSVMVNREWGRIYLIERKT